MTDRTRRDVLASTGVASAIALAGCVDATLPDGGTNDEQIDRTGRETVTVAVGADSGFVFAPANVTVDPGTTIVWEWTGDGGGHNVVETEKVFESELTNEAGHTFEHMFDDAGLFEYVCTPHQTQGMVGSVEVVE